jgi:hypothetical protein
MVNIVFLVIYVLLNGMLSPEEMIYLFSVHCIICIITHLRKYKKDIVTPIFIFYISVLLVNDANLSLIWDSNTGNLRTGSYLVPKHIPEAIYLWCISTTLTIIGYNLAIKKSFPSIALEINNKKIFRIIFWVLVITNLAKIFVPGSFEFSSTIFRLLNTFSILFFARLWTRENSREYKFYALSLYVLITFVALKYAFLRFDLILPTISLFAGYFIGIGNLKFLFSYRVVPFLLVILVYSSVFKTLQSNRSDFYSVFFGDDEVGTTKEAEPTGTGLLERSSNISQITSVFKLVEQNGFYKGAASEPLVAAVIPRFLWPDKPNIALGGWFASEITGTHLASGTLATNSINMSIPGELYLDFGWLGVIFGSLITGAFFAMLWNTTQFYSSEYNLSGIVFGGYLFIVAIGNFGADLQIIISLMSLYFAFLIIKKLVH